MDNVRLIGLVKECLFQNRSTLPEVIPPINDPLFAIIIPLRKAGVAMSGTQILNAPAPVELGQRVAPF